MINWFPGHMKKSLEQIQNYAKFCNVFIYVLDARAPVSCLNTKFKKILGDKPVVYVLNKTDLAQDLQNIKYKNYFSSLPNSRCVAINANVSNSANVILKAINSLLSPLIEKNKANQINYIFRAMVIGVPNCGKTTIVNNFLKKAQEKTENRPGVTKSVKWIKVGKSLEIMDTPGTLMPNFESEQTGYNLAYIGSIKNEILSVVKLAEKFIVDTDFEILQKRYNIKQGEPLDVLNQIAKLRGCVLKGGELDIERAAVLILTDFRKGALGKITLEKFNETIDKSSV